MSILILRFYDTFYCFFWQKPAKYPFPIKSAAVFPPANAPGAEFLLLSAGALPAAPVKAAAGLPHRFLFCVNKKADRSLFLLRRRAFVFTARRTRIGTCRTAFRGVFVLRFSPAKSRKFSPCREKCPLSGHRIKKCEKIHTFPL